MLRATTFKAAGNGLLRSGPSCLIRRRSYNLAAVVISPTRSRPGLSLTSRRPLGIVDSVPDARRRYVVAAENTDKGVVSICPIQSGSTITSFENNCLWGKKKEKKKKIEI